MKMNCKLSLKFLAVSSLFLFASCDKMGREGAASAERESPGYRAAMDDYRAGRLSRAADGFRKVCRENPANASARFQLACLLMDSLKDYAGAYCAFKEFVQQCPEGDKARLAKDRIVICEKELAKILASRFGFSAEGGIPVAEAEDMRKRLKDSEDAQAALKKSLEDAQKRNVELEESVKQLKSLIADAPDVDATPRDTSDIKALLEGDEDAAALPPKNDAAEVIASFDADAEASMPFKQDQAAKDARDKAKKDADEAEKARKAEAEALKARIPDTYVVQEGDTLYKIALKFYGKSSAWKLIREANRTVISNDGRIRAGQKLVMPK
jgi:TolA-binding protein